MDDSFYFNASTPADYLSCFMHGLERRNPNEPEFHQAVEEVARSVIPFIFENQKYLKAQIFERMTEPDRIISFRVCWEDDVGNVRTNRGYRVQFNNAIGPYKGGLRFHSSVDQSILKFLGFEQIFKNSLTALPMGAGKGGANFNPKGKTDREIMRFCQAFMIELSRHIGEDVDVPAGDIGVSGREISYMFGQYKHLTNRFVGVLTGKGLEYGGSEIRTEATGYGLVYFAEEVLQQCKGESFLGKTCLISGAGNVAQYAAEKIHAIGGRVIAMSDSTGFIYDPKGIHSEKLAFIHELKYQRKSLEEYAVKFKAEYHKGKTLWGIKADYALPCAIQNEIDVEEAKQLIANGCKGVFEGANMPTTIAAIDMITKNGLAFAPSKAANAGGVAVSGLEMSQNSMRLSWAPAEVDARLRVIMRNIHAKCVKYGETAQGVDYVKGANIAGFVKVADAMLAYGIN